MAGPPGPPASTVKIPITERIVRELGRRVTAMTDVGTCYRAYSKPVEALGEHDAVIQETGNEAIQESPFDTHESILEVLIAVKLIIDETITGEAAGIASLRHRYQATLLEELYGDRYIVEHGTDERLAVMMQKISMEYPDGGDGYIWAAVRVPIHYRHPATDPFVSDEATEQTDT